MHGMPGAIKDAAKYSEVVNEAERVMLVPFRELLIEGKATGELAIEDVSITAISLMGAVNMVGLFQLVQTGSIDVAHTTAVLVPQLTGSAAEITAQSRPLHNADNSERGRH